ncbi:SixA phosphatase family protein [Croceicoccus marinus]|uniref:Histidine phosphatase family protein n=1 Tax=Croceicoccus marinus TaxID=450378 RepID=A0A7G6VWW0_9SPHN|nr:histidine phosphatase family protein [Croceicoccus marinus]QNE06225.1 histidine phosphatase family protein [Croceicoccus marinus]
MKVLGLLRHAKSEEHQPSGRDYDRGLNPKGRRAAAAMGRALARVEPPFERVVASAAARAQETIDIALDAMGRSAPVERVDDKKLYLADPGQLIDSAVEHGGNADSLLLVAHNPGLEELVLQLVPADPEDRLRAIAEQKFPTGAFALIELDIADWSELPRARGRLIALTRPRDLDPALGPEYAG